MSGSSPGPRPSLQDVRGETALLHFLASTSLQRGDRKGQEAQQFQAKKQQDSAQGIEANRRHRNSAHEAVKRARQAMVYAKRNADVYAEASAMAHLAHALAILNRGQEGLGTCRRAEDLFREVGAVSEQASAVCLSAEIANLMGNKPKALELANRALELARRAEDGTVEGRVLGVMELIKGVQKQVQQEIPDQMFAAPDAGAGAGAASAAAAVPKGLDPVMVQQKLMHVVEQVSGGGDEVHLDTPLMESGLDSLSAVAFRNELSRQFEGVGALPAALMFDYPSARAIADHLVKLVTFGVPEKNTPLGVTCLVFVPAAHGQPPCLLVNTSDSSASIIDCTYGPPAGVLTNLAVRHRVRVAHALLPLKCCYSPSNQGFLISASEDKDVYIFSLAKGANYKMSWLKHHQVPVVAVATNHQEPTPPRFPQWGVETTQLYSEAISARPDPPPAMFATNGFIKVSERRMDAARASRAAAGLGGLRQVRSDPALPRIESSKKLHMVDRVADDSGVHRRHRADSKLVSALMPPGRLEEVTGEVLASIEGIRSSMEHFQGRRKAIEDVHQEQDPDALEDLQQRLACYRYARRIEPPAPPLAMDPSFDPAPPRAFAQLAIPRPSASHLESFLPQRRRVKLAEQAETRRLRLEAAKVKRQISEQERTRSPEHSEKTSKEVDRYLQRMDRFESFKRASRPGPGGPGDSGGPTGGVDLVGGWGLVHVVNAMITYSKIEDWCREE
eukprot:s2853_g9.t1